MTGNGEMRGKEQLKVVKEVEKEFIMWVNSASGVKKGTSRDSFKKLKIP